MTDEQSPTADVDQVRAAAALTAIEALGFTLEELLAFRDSGATPSRVTLHEYLQQVRAATKPASCKVYEPYWKLLDVGVPNICGCNCDACVSAVTLKRRNGKPGPARIVMRAEGCPCRTSGTCRCADLVAGTSCLDHFDGYGTRFLGEISLANLQTGQRWAKARALRRDRARDLERARAGKAVARHLGHSAEEHYVGATRAVFRLACADPQLGLRANPAEHLYKPERPDSTGSRALNEDQLVELWEALWTTESQDAELDALLFWDSLESGSRRGGKIGRTCSDLLIDQCAVRLREKNEKERIVPISFALMCSLIGHALERGDVVQHTIGGLDLHAVTVDDVLARRATLHADAPVFYYGPQRVRVDGHTVLVPHPLTGRRLETSFARLRDHLPWADEAFVRPHDLRHTGGKFIERVLGFAIAKAWLGHKGADVTDTYVGAVAQELVRANETLTGRPHPGRRRGNERA